MDELKKSLDIIRLMEGPEDYWNAAKKFAIDAAGDSDVQDLATTAAAGYGAGKVASKVLGKKIPGVGTALYGKDAYDRYKKGDYTGAALQGAGAIASLIPGAGTIAALGADAATAYHDYNSTAQPDSTDTNDDTDPRYNDLPDDADTDIAALQIQLQDLGAEIKVDGKPSHELIKLAKQYKLMD